MQTLPLNCKYNNGANIKICNVGDQVDGYALNVKNFQGHNKAANL